MRRTRAERALTTVIATCYLKGASTRRMNDLVATLGITNLSKSQVSGMAKELDVMVEDFRTRPLDTGPYLYGSCDALTMKVREGGRVVKTSVLLATGVNAEGYRELLGMQVATAESITSWTGFLCFVNFLPAKRARKTRPPQRVFRPCQRQVIRACLTR